MSHLAVPVTTEPDVHGMFTELTRIHAHREPYVYERGLERWHRHHRSQVPALVHQLLGATPPSSGAESGSGAVSKPAARIESLDTVMLIDDEAGEWIDHLGGVIPSDRIDPLTLRTVAGTGTIARLLRLHGMLAAADRCERPKGRRGDGTAWCCTAHHIEHDVRRWWHQARIITGWDSPAYRPFNTCPVCEHRGGLRVNIAMQAAFCIECRTIWDPSQIGLLAEHIRGENAEGDQTGHAEDDRSA